MTHRYAELLMYVAPQEVREANERWIERIVEKLGMRRGSAQELDLVQLWLSPQLLFT